MNDSWELVAGFVASDIIIIALLFHSTSAQRWFVIAVVVCYCSRVVIPLYCGHIAIMQQKSLVGRQSLLCYGICPQELAIIRKTAQYRFHVYRPIGLSVSHVSISSMSWESGLLT